MRKFILPLLGVLLLTSCGPAKPRKKSSSSSDHTSAISDSSKTSITSQGKVGEFTISETALNIDWKDTTSFTLNAGVGGVSPTAGVSISWSVSELNVVRYEYATTNNFEDNTFTIFSTGHITVSATWSNYTVNCDVNITNSNIHKSSGEEKIKIFAMNDFHGQVKGKNDIKIIGSFLKEKLKDPNTLYIDSGDTWQGSLESNYNYGAMITDVYNYAGATARTIGNHDFDWGQEKLVENVNRSYNGMRTTTLAANIYDYDFENKVIGKERQKQFGEEYKIVNMRSGLKVGIIGTIGISQITSISTQLVSNITFTDHIETTKEISDYLRKTEECDLVIASFHEPVNWFMEQELTETSPISGYKYVDLVFNGHSHALESDKYNGVLFAQYASNGNFYGEVDLTYNYVSKNISTQSLEHYFYEMEYDIHRIDPVVNEIVDTYLNETKDLGNQVLTNNCNNLRADSGIPGLISKASYDEAIKQGFDVSYAYANSARATLKGPTVTFSDLYTALPFDNQIYILEVPGIILRTQIESTDRTMFYRGNTEMALKAFDITQNYNVAILDYLAFHTNEAREYDYFPGCKVLGKLEFPGYYTYRELVRDYFLEHQDTAFTNSAFSTGEHFDSAYLDVEISK